MNRLRRHWKALLISAGALVFAAVALAMPICWRAWIFEGVRASYCPDGDFRQTVWAQVNGVQRGGLAYVRVGALAHYARVGSEYDETGTVRRLAATLALVDPSGKETPLVPDRGWRTDGPVRACRLKFPSVPDGDYRIRVRAHSPLGDGQVDVPLALYAPARVHVITDRPLYRPGDLIKFRAVVLRARDLVPLDGRPGQWEVRAPDGELVLQEKAPAGNWGVVAGTFPLDTGAPEGDWKIAWSSGDARDEVTVRVQPFVLPRFRIEAAAAAPFYRPLEKPVVKGRVVYSSGAPVSGARLDIAWSVAGSWPPPNDWLDHALPQHALADRSGNFTLALPEVPSDLQGQAPLTARISATDASGDRVEGAATVLLAQDAISVSAVTELADGVVEGFNNRLFLRATTASGEVLPEVQLRVKRAWDPDDPGITAETDEDGVAQLQIDPGPPVNVVIPPPPFRPQPPTPAVQLENTTNLLSGEEVPLADESALERIVPALGACARFAGNQDEATLGLEVDAAGAIVAVGHASDALASCAAASLRSARLPPGSRRLYRIGLEFSDDALAQVSASYDGEPAPPDPVRAALDHAVADARGCLPTRLTQGEVETATWHFAKGSKQGSVSWASEGGHAHEAQGCLQSRASTIALADASTQDLVGIARVQVSAAAQNETDAPEPTTMLGYELKVQASRKDQSLGETTLRIGPGTVPPLRLRATPVLAQAGATVALELLRGPGFEGELPEKAFLRSERGGDPLEAKLDPDTRTAQFRLPADAGGWYAATAGSAQALVYVRSKAELAVALATERDRYAPGQKARLSIRTTVAGRGAQAAVGLFGVDESLAQLVPLPGPDDLARVRPKVEMSSAAFGALDGEALALGRIRGANAAMATVMRVSSLPAAAPLDGYFSGHAQADFDPDGELTDRFYDVLGELHAEAREWEAHAPRGEKMHPAEMARLWKSALAAVKARGGSVTDAYGRELRLSELPGDLLALTDPRAVIVSGTRLPEDVENWAAYVAKEKP